MASSKKVSIKPEAKAVVPAVKPVAPKAEEKVTVKAVAKTEEKKAETPAAAAKAVLASEKKETAKKPAEKKPAAKKPGRKTAAKKVDLKASVCIQFSGKSYSEEELIKMAKDVWKYDLKQKAGELESIELYVKPEENLVYYVMNKDFAGNFYI